MDVTATTPVPDLMTPDELAAYLHVPVSTIYRWNHSGLGPARVRVGRRIRYRATDVIAWLDSRRVA